MDDPYVTLGVDRNATAAEIKSKYFAVIKTATPEGDPARFRLVTEAYKVLSNPERRRALDAQERLPPDVVAELEACAELDESESATKVSRLARLHRKHPSLRAVRFAYGVALDGAKKHEEAILVFRVLYEEHPTNAVYATWLGDAYLQAGNSFRGVQLLQEAIVLDAKDPSPYICLVRHHMRRDETDEALRLLDRAIRADGSVDVADLQLIIHKILILAGRNRWDALKSTVGQLPTLLPASDAAGRKHIASQAWQLAEMFEQSKRVDCQVLLLDCVIALDPEAAKIRGFVDKLRPAARRAREESAFFDDASMPQWLKAFVYAMTADAADAGQREKNKNILVNIAHEIGLDLEGARKQWSAARDIYPVLLGCLEGAWERLQRAAAAQHEPTATSKSGNGWLPLAIIVGVIWLLAKGCK